MSDGDVSRSVASIAVPGLSPLTGRPVLVCAPRDTAGSVREVS
ncbi:hypothetical protein NRB56_26060 [Nocardia sp. RB56]|uniref:Uncharacterized protein n=1 Tax=Nocardia aurantia TaxID=2585199 RepID=A0A7K0DQC4_9NOCA|nr:hypothetical protein [Nocardia aurantia]